MKKTVKPSGIRDIAQALGVSIGTVDRALHRRPGVNEETRERVLLMAKKLSYTPNLAARQLKLNRKLTIGVMLPDEIASFFNQVRQGIRSAAAAAPPTIEVSFHSFPRLGEGELAALKNSDWERFDGMILATGNPAELAPYWASIESSGKPVVLVATDAPHTRRIASVTVDGAISGSIAADLFRRTILSPAPVALLTGDLRIPDHVEKLKGFAATLAQLAPNLPLLPVMETHDHPDEAYDAMTKLLKKHPNLGGVYVSTANSLPVIAALRETESLGRVQVVTTDLFNELVPLIEQDQVLATLEQRPFTQGRLSFEILTAYLTNSELPRERTRLAPHIILRSNLPIFLDRLSIR